MGHALLDRRRNLRIRKRPALLPAPEADQQEPIRGFGAFEQQPTEPACEQLVIRAQDRWSRCGRLDVVISSGVQLPVVGTVPAVLCGTHHHLRPRRDLPTHPELAVHGGALLASPRRKGLLALRTGAHVFHDFDDGHRVGPDSRGITQSILRYNVELGTDRVVHLLLDGREPSDAEVGPAPLPRPHLRLQIPYFRPFRFRLHSAQLDPPIPGPPHKRLQFLPRQKRLQFLLRNLLGDPRDWDLRNFFCGDLR
mmetsp:Transcript_44062/g.104898  ORF Transcript_44062/g.104898 Transcript_44062/m.104898 type:complete len:252 (+) Transcript_44062:1072-1827(+)